MKANESNSNYPSRLREMTNFTIREIKKICARSGERESGEENERKAQSYIAESMKNVADGVTVEDFGVHPRAYTGTFTVSAVLMLISVVLLVLRQFNVAEGAGSVFGAVAAVLSVVAVSVIAGEFFLLKNVVDFLFPKRQSCNVICTRKPSGEIKRRIIFGGHIDSSYEYRYCRLGGIKLQKTVVSLLLVSVILNIVLDVLSFVNLPKTADIIIAVISLITLIPVIMSLFCFNRKTVIQGANGLTGVFSSMAVMRYMAANDVRFENTEVVSVSLACGEAGARGAQAFSENYTNDGVETVFIVTDTLNSFDGLSVLTKDGPQKLDPKTAELIKKAGETAGVNLSFKDKSPAVTDAAGLDSSKIKCAALTAAGEAPDKFYHTAIDKPDALVPKTIEAGINVLLETAFLFDSEGVKN